MELLLLKNVEIGFYFVSYPNYICSGNIANSSLNLLDK